MESWKHDQTWQMIEALLLEKRERALSKLLNPDTNWEQTLVFRGRLALIDELLKLPETNKMVLATTTRGQNAR